MIGETIDNQYQLLEVSWDDLVSTEYRALDQRENRAVTIKLLREEVCRRSSESLYRYRKLIRDLSARRDAQICSVFGMGEWKGRDYVVLENPAGEPLSRIRRATLKIEDVVDIVHGVCRALDAAHQHGILHGLLNPECVLLDASAEDCVVKVRNFGAGLLLDLTTVRSAEEVRRVFTYLAPEQSGILRRPADARSDIYSLGIVFYELLAGVPPYEAKDVNELISEHISRQPAPPSRSNPEVPEILERMVLKLIAKDPEDRYQTLGGLIADLEEYESRKRSGAERIQFEIAQNDRQRKLSFQTRLIGREAELAKLQLAAEHACRGEGGVCFIHGEPGIGKTRLINELRADVHRLGGVFIGGKCYQYESGTPFKALSEAIEAYVERVRRISPADRDRRVREMKQSIGDLGGEVLKLTPKIRELIGEPPSLAQLEPDKQRARFLVTAVSFLAELGTPELPVVIFLEDLQWSDEGTVELLDRLAPKLDERAVLLIISYRSNEVGPEHPLIRLKTRLEQAGVAFDEIGVRAFDSAETEVMVSRILGERPEAVRLVAEFLHARTRGNPFFNLELLRTLVEEKVVQYQDGHYRCAASELERAQLPENIVEAVLRRIKDVPPEDIGVLSYAAVIGKQVDLGLLGRLSGRTPEELLVSVENGIQHQILSRDPMSDGSVQFVHDRVREAFYRRVDENEVVRLHRRIAEALEAEHPKAEGVVAYDLAYHYSKSRVDEKAFIYSRKAAELAILASAHALAIQLFDQARETLERLGRGQGPDMIQVLENLGELYRLSGSFEEALKSLRQCEAMIPQGDMQGRAQVLAKMADAFFERGEAAKAAILIERALRRIGASLPRTRFGLNLAITREFLKQLYHIVRPEWMCRRFPEATVLDSIKVRLISRLVYIHYFNDMDRSFHAFLSNLNLCENRAISKVLASQYVLGGPVWMTFPWFWKAKRDLNRGLELARRFGDSLQEARVLVYFAFVMRIANKPNEGLEYCRKAIRALKTLGEYYDLGVAYVFRNHCNWMGVTPLGQALRENEEFIELVREANMLQPLGWALFNKGIFAAFRGDINDEVVKTVQEGHRLMVQLKDLPDVLYSLAFMALVHLRRSDYDNAIDTVGEIEKLLPTHELKASWIQEVFPICSQVYLDTIAHNPDLPEATVAEYLKGAQRFVSKAVSRARRFDFIMGWACQVNGTYWWMRGKKKRAQRAWEQGIKFLRQKENSYRLGYLQLEAARWRLKDDPQDRKAYEYLVEAKDLFQRMDAPRDLKEVNAFLEKMEARNVDVESRSALTFKRHLDSLLSVTQAIGSVFGIEDLLERVVQYAIKVTGAERGFILLRSRDGGPLELRVEKGLDPKWRGKPFSYENFGLSLLLVDEVMRRNEALVSSAADPNPIGQELKSYGVRQAMGIALRTKDKELGVLYLDNRLAEGVFSDEELELMKSFGVQASVSIENSRLVQSLVEQDRLKQEMKLGRDIQQGFLPKQAPEVSGIKVAAFMEPAREIGGDYYDYIVRGDNGSGKFAVVIGDVTGKGVGAGLNMALVKTALRSLTQEPIGWREILVKANKILCKQMAFGTFVTLLGLEWDPNARRVSYSGAGHGEFLVHRRASGLVDVIRCGGTALGLIPDIGAKINEQALAVEPGDRIVLFTDGVTEAPNEADEQFGLERLREAVARFGGATPSELIEKIRGEVATFRGKREQYDDITLIALEIAG